MSEIFEALSVIGFSAVKLLASALWSFGLGNSFWESVVFTSVGGSIGVFVFYRVSGWFMKRARLRRLHQAIAVQHGVKKEPPRMFTKRNRWIIRIKQSKGLFGLALLTPIVLTIPVGAIIAARYFGHDRRTLPALLSAVVVQAIAVCAVISAMSHAVDIHVN